MSVVASTLPSPLDAALRDLLGDGWLRGDEARRRYGEDSSKRWPRNTGIAPQWQ